MHKGKLLGRSFHTPSGQTPSQYLHVFTNQEAL